MQRGIDVAGVKFGKGSEEWLMFMDFWNLCQLFWKPETSEKYWDDLMNKSNQFCEKYKEIKLSRGMAKEFISYVEEKYKNVV